MILIEVLNGMKSNDNPVVITQNGVAAAVPEAGSEEMRELIHGNYRIVYRLSGDENRDAGATGSGATALSIRVVVRRVPQKRKTIREYSSG